MGKAIKTILKILTVILFTPMFILALVFGLIRFLFDITILFSWNTSDDVHYYLLKKSKTIIDFVNHP